MKHPGDLFVSLLFLWDKIVFSIKGLLLIIRLGQSVPETFKASVALTICKIFELNLFTLKSRLVSQNWNTFLYEQLENYQALLWWIFQMGKFIWEMATLPFFEKYQLFPLPWIDVPDVWEHNSKTNAWIKKINTLQHSHMVGVQNGIWVMGLCCFV